MKRRSPIGAEAQLEQSRERRAARKIFAYQAAARIREAGIDALGEGPATLDAWRAEAEAAKAQGLYAPSTYVGDVATGLCSHWRKVKEGGRH